MELEIFDMEQGSDAWVHARLGIPTASEFHTVMAGKGPRGGETKEYKTRRKYMLSLIGERLTGEQMDRYSNSHMERGHEFEPEARDLYAMVSDVEPVRVGFMRRGDVGASPDSLIGENGILEIKTKLPHLQLECLLEDAVPISHKPQIQGQLWVAGREWLDFVSYWPGLPLFVARIYRDEEYIRTLAAAVRAFNDEMAELMAKVKQYRRAA